MQKTVFFLLFITLNCFAQKQDFAVINSNIGISDSLKIDKEIRVYKVYQLSSSVEIVQIKKEDSHYKATIFYYSSKFNDATKINKITFVDKKIGERFWLDLLLTNIEFLPSIDKIRYKLSEKRIIEENNNLEIEDKKTKVLDGVSYFIMFKDGKTYNYFEFNNPDIYMKLYNKVDEIDDYNRLIKLISSTLNIWE